MKTHATSLAALIWWGVLFGSGCANPIVEPADGLQTNLEILSILFPQPVLAGSDIHVTVRGSLSDGTDRYLELTHQTIGVRLTLDSAETLEPGRFRFALFDDAISSVGPGLHPFDAVFVEGEVRSPPYPIEMDMADVLPLDLYEVDDRVVYRNDSLILHGSGFLTPQEGSLWAQLDGTFTADREGGSDLEIRLPVTPAEQFDRERGVLRLSTAIGGLRTGVFSGTIRLHSELRSGSQHESTQQSLRLEFLAPAIFELTPIDPNLGQWVTLRGGGFVGHPDEPDEVTLLRFTGTLTPEGEATRPFGPEEAVLLYLSGQQARWPIDVVVQNQWLVSDFFGITRGRFRGTVMPITISGTQELAGEPLSVDLDLAGVRQIVVVRFLPGFWDSLRYFGLSAASQQVAEALLARARDIWSDYNLEFITQSPEDFLQSAYSVLEIGGPDPNGLGLMGYENTQGKDINNLRLFDQIGGANAATQEDGFPGYGGVFIESYLYWSENPGLEGPRPFGSPQPDPLFDEIFGPVRDHPATLDEAEGQGELERVEVVSRAVFALGNIAGETAAHEVGHSVGLAQPYEPVGHYHSIIPGPGCLMDGGADRPLGERSAQPGFDVTHFCYDELGYLSEILPK